VKDETSVESCMLDARLLAKHQEDLPSDCSLLASASLLTKACCLLGIFNLFMSHIS